MTVVPSWIEAHCVIPDGFRKGEPFRLYDWQLQYLAAFYEVRASATWVPDAPILAPAFTYRRAMIVGPQKLGKDPMEAAHICVEAVGPALFAGWAGDDDGYACADHGCRCGWEYPYDPGEPMGMSWPTPLIQITAFSEDQTENTYGALRPMIDDGPLADRIPKTGEEFIRLPGGGRIDTVTSSAKSRLGQRLTYASQGEVGLWDRTNTMSHVADTQYRGLAGMGGRASLNTNPWDPSRGSVAQVQYESKATDIYRQFVQPPASLSFANRRERRRIFLAVYPPDTLRENGGHVDLEAIEAEAADLAARDLPQAERFFGQRLVKGQGKAFDVVRWRELAVKRRKVVPDGALITIGGDGSRGGDSRNIHDHFSLVATEVASGYQWLLGVWDPADYHGTIPMDIVDGTLAAAIERWSVWGVYLDPPYIESWIAEWAGRWGKDRIVEWWTARLRPMAVATRSWSGALVAGDVSHCAEVEPLCGAFTAHVGNAVKRPTGYRDDSGELWTVEKERPGSPNKIDSVPAAVLSWEARNDAITAGALQVTAWTSVYEDETREMTI